MCLNNEGRQPVTMVMVTMVMTTINSTFDVQCTSSSNYHLLATKLHEFITDELLRGYMEKPAPSEDHTVYAQVLFMLKFWLLSHKPADTATSPLLTKLSACFVCIRIRYLSLWLL